jgi:uncharacterized protein (TIGR02266 family)
MANPADLRAHERWPIRLDVELLATGAAGSGQIENLSLGGAFLTTTAPLSMGTSLRLSLRLPNGMPVTASGRVVRVQAEAEGARAGVGIQFYGLDDVTRDILRNYFGSQPSDANNGALATVEQKFRVETDRKERVFLVLSGFLDKQECQNLSMTMSEIFGALAGTGVRLCIDATRYQCCTPDSVDYFRDWFTHLSKRRWLAAALVGPKSVGMMQMRRAARDAGVADSFASFNTVPEALEFLEMVRG